MQVASSSSKRASLETTVEPRGKAGKPKMFKEGTDRMNADKRNGGSLEDELKVRKKRNKRKIEFEIGGGETDDEIDEPKDIRKKQCKNQ
jgi:hypothetical protein